MPQLPEEAIRTLHDFEVMSCLTVIHSEHATQGRRRCTAWKIRCAKKINVERQSRTTSITHDMISHSGASSNWLTKIIVRKAITVMLPHSTNLLPAFLLNVRQKKAM
jgi:hypothetical protein